jgi:hypothetical protein
MTFIRNIFCCISLLPFLIVSIVPSGLDLQMQVCGGGNWGITIVSCPLETFSIPQNENGQTLSPCNSCDEWMGYTLVCGGGPRSKSDYTLAIQNDCQQLTLPVPAYTILESSPSFSSQNCIPITTKIPLDIHPIFLHTVSFLI